MGKMGNRAEEKMRSSDFAAYPLLDFHFSPFPLGASVRSQPIPDRWRLRISRIKFEGFGVMFPGFGGLTQLLGKDIGQRDVRPGFIRVISEEILQFLFSIQHEIALLQHHRKIIARV